MKKCIPCFSIFLFGLLACNNSKNESNDLAGTQAATTQTKRQDIDEVWKKMPGEERIDTWTILYEPPNGGKFNGKLLVTNKRLLYDAGFDYSTKGILEEFAFIKWDSEGFLEINKEDIIGVETKKSFLSKKCIITLKDGSKHTFNYGAMNIDKCAAAIQSK